ncbi:hypothetical protein IPdc08_00239 [archaeon]|nr:hypothetical protein IPdc08_00239 [archaeon]
MDFIIVFIYGIFVGMVTGMLGAGGGTLIVPFLNLYLHMPMKTAIGTSLFQYIGISSSGAYQHYKLGSSDLMVALILIISGSVTSIAGAKVGKVIPNHILKLLFGALVLIIAVKFLKPKSKRKASEAPVKVKKAKASHANTSTYYHMLHDIGKSLHLNIVSPIPMYMHRKTKIAEYTINVPLVFILGGVVGFFTGLLGVGGGFLYIPGLMMLSIPMKVTVGASLTPIIVTSTMGAATYLTSGYVDIVVGIILMIGGIIGTFIGTRLNKKLPTSTLKKSFGLLMLLIGFVMITKAMGLNF